MQVVEQAISIQSQCQEKSRVDRNTRLFLFFAASRLCVRFFSKKRKRGLRVLSSGLLAFEVAEFVP